MKKQYTQKLVCSLLTSVYLLAAVVTASAQNWHAKNEGLPVTNAKAVYGEGTHIVYGNESGLIGSPIYSRPDSGTAFTASTVPQPQLNYVYINSIVKCQGSLFTGLQNHGIYKSTDIGQTWTETSEIQIIYNLYSDGTDMYASMVGGFGTPNVSTDAGATWTVVPNYAGAAIAISFLKYNGTLFVGANDGLQYTTDNGATWHAVTTPSDMAATPIYSVVQLNGNVYAACNTGVYKSTDNGVTWANVMTDYVWYLAAVDTVLLAGTNSHGISASDKNGGNWHAINTGLPNAAGSYDKVNSISSNDQFVITAVEGDSSIYVTTLASLGLAAGSSTGVASQQKTAGSVTISPNPSKGVFTVKCPDDKKGTLNVYDMSAHLVLSREQVSGNEQIDMSNVGTGIYLLKLETADALYSQKLSVVK